MSTADIAIDVIAAAAAAIVSMTGAGAVLTPAVIAAVKAAALAIADYTDGKIDAPTLMERVTSMDAAVKADNATADTALDAKFKA